MSKTYEPTNNTTDMPKIILEDGTRLYYCEFRNRGSYILKKEHSDYKPLILKLWNDYTSPASSPRAKQKAEEQLRYYNDFLKGLIAGQFDGELEDAPVQTKREMWNAAKRTQKDVMAAKDKFRGKLPEEFNTVGGSTKDFVDYMKVHNPRDLKLLDVEDLATDQAEIIREGRKKKKASVPK